MEEEKKYLNVQLGEEFVEVDSVPQRRCGLVEVDFSSPVSISRSSTMVKSEDDRGGSKGNNNLHRSTAAVVIFGFLLLQITSWPMIGTVALFFSRRERTLSILFSLFNGRVVICLDDSSVDLVFGMAIMKIWFLVRSS
ncbi:hypothetical protein K1719_013621 [Acacia pycnantha]|nr:hypothetical protein K1719_013621 [Acacia pycnantha]